MNSNLNALGLHGGAVFIIIIGIVIASEIIKALTTIFSSLISKYAGIKTKYSEKKKLDAMVVKNKEDLDKFIDKQHNFNTEVKESLSSINTTVKDVSDVVVSIQVESMRSTILDFASSVSNGRVYTKEQFNYVKKIHKQYEEVIKQRGITNDEVELSMLIIEKAYEDRVMKHNFIEDRITDPAFQEKLQEMLDKVSNE